ncbi:MAG: hypothetical protein Q7N50_04150 [Armatimonadota bacterium]|nr:hypothetical protein [Armatimonadota bacterium]
MSIIGVEEGRSSPILLGRRSNSIPTIPPKIPTAIMSSHHSISPEPIPKTPKVRASGSLNRDETNIHPAQLRNTAAMAVRGPYHHLPIRRDAKTEAAKILAIEMMVEDELGNETGIPKPADNIDQHKLRNAPNSIMNSKP